MTSGLREVKEGGRAGSRTEHPAVGQRLKLKVNVAKSVIAPAATAVLLGMASASPSSGVRLRIAPEGVVAGKARIPCSHVPAVGVSMDYRVRRLNQYVRGLDGIFPVGAPRKFSDLDEWYRRRLRQIGGRNGNGRGRGWRICVPSGFGLIWPGSGACQSWLLAYCRSLRFCTGRCRPAIAGTWCRVLSPSLGWVSNDLANRRMRGPRPVV